MTNRDRSNPRALAVLVAACGAVSCAGDQPQLDGGVKDAPAQEAGETGPGDKVAGDAGEGTDGAGDGSGTEGGSSGPWKKVPGLDGCEQKYRRAAFPMIGPGGFSPAQAGPAQSISFSVGGSVRNVVGFFQSKPAAGGSVTVDIREGGGMMGGPGPASITREAVPGEMLPVTPSDAVGGGEYYRLVLSKPAPVSSGSAYWILLAAAGLGVEGSFQWYYDKPSGGTGTGLRSTILPGSDRVNFEYGVNCP